MNLHRLAIAVSAFALLTAGHVAAASKPKINEVCLADFHKLCPTQELGRGVVMRCARVHLEVVSADCKSTVDTANALNAARKSAKAAKRAGAAASS